MVDGSQVETCFLSVELFRRSSSGHESVDQDTRQRSKEREKAVSTLRGICDRAKGKDREMPREKVYSKVE